ncbi:MAG: MBL fold metallo-hydrolase, partial [Clostridia bacterium]
HMKVTSNIFNVGVDTNDVDLFEGQYDTPQGMAYNSYLIVDKKVALLDTVDASVTDEWLSHLDEVLQGREIDYLVVSHMEPDHSANIKRLLAQFPKMQIVCNAKSLTFLKQFFDCEFDNTFIVKENDELSLGEHTLKFIFAPMVHWPEVMVTYETSTRTLFSADAFGKFGRSDAKELWLDEARRYYINIVGKYGAMVQSLFKKLSGVTIDRICALHGLVLTENLPYYLDLYNTWSLYNAEVNGVLVAYASIYGNTKKAALSLVAKLNERGVTCEAIDLARSDMSQNIALAFKYSGLVVAAPTCNAEIFPVAETFLKQLKSHNFQSRKV